MTGFAARLGAARERIAEAGGDVAAITIVAVTKGFGAEAVEAATAAGVADLGENYAQELLAKVAVAPGARWHFLGRVQRRKVAALAPHVAVWQGVDRLVAGIEIARRRPGATVLVQVNVDGSPQRNGCLPSEVESLVDGLAGLGLDVAGLMAVATPGDRGVAAEQFGAVASLRRRLGLRELSLGMSDDLEVAVQAGTTMVRLGRALFGDRPERPLPGADDVRR